MTSRRKRHIEEPENNERWLVSYADFITLLFAFFVVMYAISSLNEEKYKIVSKTLKANFNEPVSKIEPLEFDDLTKYLANAGDEPATRSQTIKNELEEENYISQVPIRVISERARQFFKGLIARNQLALKETSDWLEIEISSNLLFDSGSAELRISGENIILNVASFIKEFEASISIEGFTDNIPIENDIFPSNWELSTGRAASVIRLLIEGGVPKDRLSAVGYGENFPSATNGSNEGRTKNRRVIILIEKANKRKSYLWQESPISLEEAVTTLNGSNFNEE